MDKLLYTLASYGLQSQFKNISWKHFNEKLVSAVSSNVEHNTTL